jgi:hypothetical protein
VQGARGDIDLAPHGGQALRRIQRAEADVVDDRARVAQEHDRGVTR